MKGNKFRITVIKLQLVTGLQVWHTGKQDNLLPILEIHHFCKLERIRHKLTGETWKKSEQNRMKAKIFSPITDKCYKLIRHYMQLDN